MREARFDRVLEFVSTGGYALKAYERFAKLRPGKEYENLYASAAARAEADWLVGINATRALTCKYNAQLSCGRVQTPTLSIIAQREQEIQNFQPKTYYGIRASVQGFDLIWQDSKSKDVKTFDKEFQLTGDYPREPEPVPLEQPVDYVVDAKTADLDFGE